MAFVHAIEGPIGAGKSTYASVLGRRLRSQPLILDTWMATLFRPDRPEQEFWDWYQVRKERCITQILDVAKGSLRYHAHAIVELGLLSRRARSHFASLVEGDGHACVFHLLDASEDERWERVQLRNARKSETYVMQVSRELFELSSGLWEDISPAERSERRVIDVQDSLRIPDEFHEEFASSP